MVFGLAILACIADQHFGELGVVDAVFFLAGLAERAAVKADDRRMTEIGIDAIETGGIGHGHIDVVGPRHRFRHHHLLILGRIHVALAADDQLGPLHGAVAPDLGIIAVITDDERYLEPLGSVGNVGAIAGIPALDRHAGHDLAIFLHYLVLVVHQDEGVVGCLL